MSNSSCLSCAFRSVATIAESASAFAIRDAFPVRLLHTLIIPKRHVADIFETTAEEREARHLLALECRAAIMRSAPEVEGFKYGSKVGAAAGQKNFDAHIHLIPRRVGDTPPPPARPAER